MSVWVTPEGEVRQSRHRLVTSAAVEFSPKHEAPYNLSDFNIDEMRGMQRLAGTE